MRTLARLVDEVVFNVQSIDSNMLGIGLSIELVDHAQHIERGNIHELGSGTEENANLEGVGGGHGWSIGGSGEEMGRYNV